MLCRLVQPVRSLTGAIQAFIEVLNAECEVLKKAGLMPPSVEEPWRYPSAPLDDEHTHEHLRAVLEAGRCTVQAEQHLIAGEELLAWQSLSAAQQALLNHLSTLGRAAAKRMGQSKGGSAHNPKRRIKIIEAAEDLLPTGECLQDYSKLPCGLVPRTRERLEEEGFPISEAEIRKILKQQL